MVYFISPFNMFFNLKKKLKIKLCYKE